MKYGQILHELYSLESPKIKLGLHRVKKLLAKIANPQKNLKYVHVAGTNGKGSVCALLHSILRESGFKTGLYTSPHLKRFNERIRINDELIPDKEIVRLYRKIKPHISDQSFFEITTAMAFLYFFEKKADIIILEVGLGGRLDATNVITPLVSVVTNIGLEHTEILGNAIEDIAYEKSGIIKKNIPLVCGAQGSSLQTIRTAAAKKNAAMVAISDKNIHSKCNKSTNTWVFDYKEHKNIELKKMKGKYQVKNAAIALEVCDILSRNHFKLRASVIQKGISNAFWPGRMQLRGNVLFDCAHNPSGFSLLMKELSYFDFDRLIAVAGFSNDKDIKKMSETISKKSDLVILTQADNSKAASIASIKNHFSKPILIKDPKKALEQAKKIARAKDLILVSGSIYLVGELL